MLFAGTAEAYATYRPGYSVELLDYMAERLAFNPRTRVADLGCGPGTASIPLAQRAGSVLAVDPNAEMLAVARVAAQRAGLGSIEFRHGTAEDLAASEPGPVEHAVFGRSFHWTNRAFVVQMLDALLPTHGTIVLLGRARARGEGWRRWPWDEAIRRVREQYLGPDRLLGCGPRHPGPSHADVLAASPFARIEQHTFTELVEYDLDHIVGLQQSYAHSAECLFDQHLGQFQDAARAAVIDTLGPGPYRITKHDGLVIARRNRIGS
jgi:SAM-dependent methyltransferase